MDAILRIPLNASPEQAQRLQALQQGFARLCNALAPLVQSTRVWNRVALHHLAYRQLREQFPDMGSQMVCNAIYSVSRTCRAVFQHPDSPLHLDKLGERPLPLLRFASGCGAAGQYVLVRRLPAAGGWTHAPLGCKLGGGGLCGGMATFGAKLEIGAKPRLGAGGGLGAAAAHPLGAGVGRCGFHPAPACE